MADQKRWFKLWCSAPSDDAIQSLPPSIRWAWAAFGAYTKAHGTKGVITITPTNAALAAQMGLEPSALIETLGTLPGIYLGTDVVRFPHGHDKPPVCEGEFVRGSYPTDPRCSSLLEEWCKRNGKLIVTWKNWQKYQEDTTAAERGRALRSKRRGEENKKREEEKLSLPEGSETVASANGFSSWPPDWDPIKARIQTMPFLGRYQHWLTDLNKWKSEDEAFTSVPATLDYLLTEAAAYCEREGYRPRTSRGLWKKLHNCMDFTAKKVEREKKTG